MEKVNGKLLSALSYTSNIAYNGSIAMYGKAYKQPKQIKEVRKKIRTFTLVLSITLYIVLLYLANQLELSSLSLIIPCVISFTNAIAYTCYDKLIPNIEVTEYEEDKIAEEDKKRFFKVKSIYRQWVSVVYKSSICIYDGEHYYKVPKKIINIGTVLTYLFSFLVSLSVIMYFVTDNMICVYMMIVIVVLHFILIWIIAKYLNDNIDLDTLEKY